MQSYWWCTILFRLVLPIAILSAVALRPTITSFMYLLMGFYLPFFSVPTHTTMVSTTGTYMKVLIITCILNCACISSFYFALFFPTNAEFDIEFCTNLEIALRTIGIIEFRDLTARDAVFWILPEPLMLGTSTVLYMVFKKLTQETDVTRAAAEMEGPDVVEQLNRKKIQAMLLNFGKYLVVMMFCVSAILRPSAVGAVYFLVFLTVLTYWACNKSLGKVYARILLGFSPLILLHVTMIMVYQYQYFQDNKNLAPESFYGRLLQLVRLRTYKDCKDPRVFLLHDQPNSTYLFPYSLFLLYYLCILVSRQTIQAKDGVKALIVAFFTFERKPDMSAKWRFAFKKAQEQVEADRLRTVNENLFADRLRVVIERFIQFIIRTSYMVANFILMIWAITYVGWKTLILLIWANVMWLLPGRRRIMLITSPLLVVWVWFLLTTSYIYSLDLPIPTRWGVVHFASGSHKESELKWLHLLIESLFAIIIIIPMRQFFQERAFEKQQKSLAEVMGISASEAVTDLKKQPKSQGSRAEASLKKWFSLLWIWIVIITMIWMDFMSTSNPFRIVFVGLAVVFVTTFQLCPFEYWKKFLWVYWWIVITYAMFNLFVVYMYQLSPTRKMMHKYVSNEESFKKFGFYAEVDTRHRFFLLASPLFFQIAIVIQLHYLQKNFNKLTSPYSPEELAQEQMELDQMAPGRAQIVSTALMVQDFLYRFMEIHLHKIILLTGWFLCCLDRCALFVPFVVLITASCIFGRMFTTFTIHLLSCFVQVLIILRLVYMNQYTKHDSWNYVGYYERKGKAYNVTLNSASWFGFKPSPHGRDYADFWPLDWCFIFVFVVCLERVVQIRQYNYKKARNLPLSRQRVVFPEINHLNCHDNTKNMLKFLVNYGFYKLGFELSLVLCSIVIMIRMDMIAILMCLCLLGTFSLSQKWMERILMPFIIVLAILIPVQYVINLGYWPTYWNHTGTRFWNSNDLRIRIQQFCYFMNMAHPPMNEKITLDFLLLLCLSRQWRTFRIARKFRGQEFGAGSNESVAHLIDAEDLVNPVPDFVTHTRNFLDLYKQIFFFSWFYLSLLATFLAGAMRPTLYSFGYILAAFFFMWEGSEMFLRPPKNILLRWNLLIFYNVLIMVFRTISQIFGCILIYEWQNVNCKVYAMFTVGCVDHYGMTKNVPNMNRNLGCRVQYNALGLEWDCICFFFLIIQQRIFKSYHFIHIVNEAKAQTVLANRGAKLIEEQRKKRRQDIDTENAQIRANIKKKMERLDANRQKIQGAVYLKRKKNHKHMIRSGDYYMFDDVERNLDIPLVPPKKEYVDSEFDPYDPMSFGEYVNVTYKSGMSKALEERALRKRQKQAVKEGKKPEDLKMALVPRASRPGSSREPDSKPPKPTFFRKLLRVLLYLFGIFEGMIVSLTAILNGFTAEFRNVLEEMDKDRKNLKAKTKYNNGARLGFNKIWHPVQSYRDFFEKSRTGNPPAEKIYYSIYGKLLRAIWYLLLSQSDWLCYIMIIMYQIVSANFISLPLPLMLFCWGALTIPKPSKTFWVVTIAYALVMSIILNLFLMEVADWNEHDFPDNPFYPPTVIGIERNISSLATLPLLCALFFHRVILQRLGLWEPNYYRTASLIQDGDYNLKGGQLVPLNKNEAPNKDTLNVQTVGVSIGDYFPKSIAHGAGKYAEGFRLFIQQLISPRTTTIPVDVYTPMFLCDLVNLVLLVFWFGYFQGATEDMGFLDYLQNNRVPVVYIGAIVAYSFLIVVDRWIYLRKNKFAKITYLFFQVMFYHIWFFVLFSMMTTTYFSETFVVQLFYVLKCWYFLFSAYQIRSGYPILISGHCLMHGTSLYHRFGFKVYMLIPYLFELRTLLDWTCTDTSLGVSDWFKMEQITENIFDQKCQQDFEANLNDTGGERKERTMKYIIGFVLFFILFLTIIFPFLIFSLGGSVGVRTQPQKMYLEIYMGSAEPVFKSFASQDSLTTFTEKEFRNLTGTFNNIQISQQLFGSFDPEDVVVVKWSSHSLITWEVSPGSLEEMIDDLKHKNKFVVRVLVRYTHVGSGDEKTDQIFGKNTVIPPLPHKSRQTLIDMLSNGTSDILGLPLVFPKFLMITKEAKPISLPLMEDPIKAKNESSENIQTDEYDDENIPPNPKRLRNLMLTLRTKNDKMWWQVREECRAEDDNYMYYLKDLVHNSCQHLVMYTFNEKVFSHMMHFVTGSGILGLYFIYFMMVIGVIRACMIDIGEIWIEDIPNSDRLMRKCKEVYVARDLQNYELEEELFGELIFIMRSRELCIKLTRE